MINILDPSLSIPDLITSLKNDSPELQKAGFEVLQTYRKLEDTISRVQRPDFEHDGPQRFIMAPYIPNKTHDAFFTSPKRIRVAVGGNRTGKSTMGAKETVAFCTGARLFYPRSHHAFRTPFEPPVKMLVVCEDWKKAAKNVIVDKLKQNIPPELLKGNPKKNESGVEYLWNLKIPFSISDKLSTIEIVTNNTDVRSLEGSDWHAVWFDEPPRRDHWIAISRGLIDRGGYSWFTLTPLAEPWIRDELMIGNANADSFEMSMYDNLYDPVTGSGALTLSHIDDFISKCSPDEVEMRIHGRFAHLVGAIFKEFSDAHIVDPFEIPKSWPRAILIDTHPRKPHAVACFTWNKGRLFCYDGFRFGDIIYDKGFGDVIPGQSIEEFEMELEKRMDPSPYIMLMDPSAKEPDLMTGQDMFHHLALKFPIDTWEKVRDKKNIIYGLQRLMKIDPQTKHPRFFVFRDCARIIHEIENYRWDEYRGASRGSHDPKGTPVKKDDDFVDLCLAAAMYPPVQFAEDTLEWSEEVPFFKY